MDFKINWDGFFPALVAIWPCLLFTAIGGWLLGTKFFGKGGSNVNVADWEGKLKERDGLVIERDGTIKTLRADLDAAKGKLTANTSIDGELATLRGQLADHEKNCQASLSAKDSEIALLREQLTTANAQVTEASARINEANQKIAEANSRTAAAAAAGAGVGVIASQAVASQSVASQLAATPEPVVVPPAPVATPPAPVATPPVPVATPPAPVATPPDDLLEIVGVGPVLNKQLNEHGITTFRQMGEWSNADADAFEAKMEDFHGRVEREDWVIQARELHLKKYGEHITGTWAPTTKKIVYAEQDDLEEIVGVGPVLAKLLHDNGIHTFRQVAQWTQADINKMQDQIEGFGDRIERENWVSQSRELHLKKYGERI
jgi:predicted flap endonuclease-1-like 5' DNA nuclease